MKNTETENGMLPTLEMCEQLTFLDQIAGVSEHHARISALQDSEKVLVETGQVSFEKYFAFLKKQGKKIDLNGCSMRMLRECYQATGDLTTLPFSLKWTGGGTTLNGRYSTLNTTEYPRTVKECSLSDILEEEVNEKYFLSSTAVKRLVSFKDSKLLPIR